jgi:hypothetical protein
MAVPFRSNRLQTTAAASSLAPSTPSLRPRPPRSHRPAETSNTDRQSGLRASVLETALEIGFGTNDTVARWIFNNPLAEAEEEEEEDVSIPYLRTHAPMSVSLILIGSGSHLCIYGHLHVFSQFIRRRRLLYAFIKTSRGSQAATLLRNQTQDRPHAR